MRTTCACSSLRRFIFAAAVRASASASMLQGLGEAETRSVLAERGEVEVRCDFCNRAYVFDAVDVAQLFNAGVASDSGRSRSLKNAIGYPDPRLARRYC